MPAPTKIWYIDPHQAPGHSDPSWIGQYGTGHRVQSWSQATRAANNWYFGLGGATGPVATHWPVTQANVKLGSYGYGAGRHIMDFTNSTLQGSGTRSPLRVSVQDFAMEYIHVKCTVNDVLGGSAQTLLGISGDGMVNLDIRGCKLEGPGRLAADYYDGNQQGRPVINILSGNPGNWIVQDNELFGFNTGMMVQADCLDYGIFDSNEVYGLTGCDPGNSDGIIFSASGGTFSSGFRHRVTNNRFHGFYDQAIDLISLYQGWIEGNIAYNSDVLIPPANNPLDDPQNTAGFILGGNAGSGGHIVLRNDIIMQPRPGMVNYTNVPAIQSRGGNGCLVVANRLVGTGSGFRNTSAGSALGTDRGRDNVLLNNTLVSTGTGADDYPLYQQRGVNLQLTNCALIAANSGRAAIDQEEDDIILRNCVTNSSSWRKSGSVGAFDIDGSNVLSATMPVGPDYFPTAALQGPGLVQARKWADIYGVRLPDNLVGGIAPDGRTSALPGVTRKWWKGWAKPGAVLS